MEWEGIEQDRMGQDRIGQDRTGINTGNFAKNQIKNNKKGDLYTAVLRRSGACSLKN